MTDFHGPADDTLFFGEALLEDGWHRDVRISLGSGQIRSIEANAAAGPSDERFACGLPGIPNLHSHAFQRLMAGMAERPGKSADSFWTWREAMYRFAGLVTPDDLRAIAAMAYVEMIESGFTRVGEFHYLHNNFDGRPYADPAEMSGAIVAAAKSTGIGLTLLPVFYANGGFGGEELNSRQRRFATTVDSFASLIEGCERHLNSLPGGQFGVAPHSLRAVNPGQLGKLIELAAGRPIHIHIAEQQREVEDCLSVYGARPVEWLLENYAVGPDWCLVHATHMVDHETGALARSGAVAGLCPITEANLGDGLFPVAQFQTEGGSFGIGSDSNVRIDLSEELRLLEYGQRLTHRARNVLADGPNSSTGASLFGRALAGGRQALADPARMAVGAPADIVALNADNPALLARNRDGWLDGWIFSAGNNGIDAVWCRGRQLVSGGRHKDREAVEAKFRSTVERLVG